MHFMSTAAEKFWNDGPLFGGTPSQHLQPFFTYLILKPLKLVSRLQEKLIFLEEGTDALPSFHTPLLG